MSQNIPTALDEDLSNRLRSFHLTEEEQHEITLLDDDVKASEEECRNSLFGKIISQKPVNFGGLRTTMGLLWGNPKGFRVLEVGKGIYQFMLPTETNVIRILNGKPWFFNNHFLILERWNPKLQPHQYSFKYTPIWVQIWGLPIQFISKDVGLKIGARIGFVDDVAIPATGSKEGRFVRVRVHMDVNVPLKRGCVVKLASHSSFWVEFRYERLPMFCPYCGLVGHDLQSCITRFHDSENDELRDAQYGIWIRASPVTQPGRRRSSSPPTRANGSGESRNGRNENSAPVEDNPMIPSFSNSVAIVDEAGNGNSKFDDLAHAELVSESRIRERFSDLTPLTQPTNHDISPVGERALVLWKAKKLEKSKKADGPSPIPSNTVPKPKANATPSTTDKLFGRCTHLFLFS
ncbi:hypothetical protein C3L33_23215, partial [Rhododendron williamsianum]